MQIVIDMSEEEYNRIKENDCGLFNGRFFQMIRNGIPLPKGHGDLFDKAEILRFLKCPKYEKCDWKNCFDCNESCCINLNNIYDLVPIIKADKGSEEV